MSSLRKILVVDDDPTNLKLVEGFLKQLGHEPVCVGNALAALKVLDRSIDLVLADVMMPRMDGFEMVEQIRCNPLTQDIPVIMVTTLTEKCDRLKAIEVGANDFITKPVDKFELRIRTDSMLRLKAQQDEIRAYASELNQMVETRTMELQQALRKLDNANREAIMHLSAAAEYKDEDTGSHIQRMARYGALIAAALGLDRDEVDLIRTSIPMHDVGKIGIPDSILFKPGKLDPAEWEVMKGHAAIGGEILGAGNSDYMNFGSIIALSHHEKWDGSGYPSGLSGEDIPLAGRICAVADVFDALTSKRSYKDAFPVDTSLAIMRDGRGSHFDPQVLDIFFKHFEEILVIKDTYQGS